MTMIEVMHKMDTDFDARTGGRYFLVAVVDTDRLDEAFRITNSIDSPWQQNDGIVRHWPEWRGGNRSTSIGDLMVKDGTVYVVQRFGYGIVGYLHLTEEQKCAALKRIYYQLDRMRSEGAQQVDFGSLMDDYEDVTLGDYIASLSPHII